MKTHLSKILFIFLSLSFCISCSYIHMPYPKVSVYGLDVLSIQGDKALAKLYLMVENKIEKKIEVKLKECFVDLNGVELGYLSQKEFTTFLPREKVKVPIDVVILNRGFVSGMLDMLMGKNPELKAIGHLQIKKFGITFSKQFEKNHKVDLKKIWSQ